MDLRQLRTFVHVAELQSISAAAERLHIAQPALSRQIQALEQELQARLLHRHGRGVTLTDAGALVRGIERVMGISTGIDEEALASARVDAVHSAVKAEAL